MTRIVQPLTLHDHQDKEAPVTNFSDYSDHTSSANRFHSSLPSVSRDVVVLDEVRCFLAHHNYWSIRICRELEREYRTIGYSQVINAVNSKRILVKKPS